MIIFKVSFIVLLGTLLFNISHGQPIIEDNWVFNYIYEGNHCQDNSLMQLTSANPNTCFHTQNSTSYKIECSGDYVKYTSYDNSECNGSGQVKSGLLDTGCNLGQYSRKAICSVNVDENLYEEFPIVLAIGNCSQSNPTVDAVLFRPSKTCFSIQNMSQSYYYIPQNDGSLRTRIYPNRKCSGKQVWETRMDPGECYGRTQLVSVDGSSNQQTNNQNCPKIFKEKIKFKYLSKDFNAKSKLKYSIIDSNQREIKWVVKINNKKYRLKATSIGNQYVYQSKWFKHNVFLQIEVQWTDTSSPRLKLSGGYSIDEQTPLILYEVQYDTIPTECSSSQDDLTLSKYNLSLNVQNYNDYFNYNDINN